MDKEMVFICSTVAFILATVFGSLLMSHEQYLRCVESVKHMQATEILAVCK